MNELDVAAWTRKQVETDLAAARIIGAGGFAPQRWDTEPPTQVNPEDIPQSRAVTDALGCPPEYICGWVQVVAYDKLNNEPDEAYGRDSEAPVALVDNGRREVDHIIRHDPRNVVADCEAKLAILDLHAIVWRDIGWLEDDGAEDSAEIPVCGTCIPKHSHFRSRSDVPEGACRTALLVAASYRHRPGYQEAWKPA